MLRVVILACALLLAGTSVAAASAGNGVYNPDQKAILPSEAIPYFGSVGVKVTLHQLNSGTFPGALSPASVHGGGPSARAGATPNPLGIGEFSAIGLLALLASAGATWWGRRSTRGTAVC